MALRGREGDVPLIKKSYLSAVRRSRALERRRIRRMYADMNGSGFGFMDMHVHTRYSDGASSVGEIETVCEEFGIGCCIADHNEIRGAIELYERGRVATLPALEVGSAENIELLLIFRSPTTCEAFFRSHVEPFRRKHWIAYLPRSLDDVLDAVREYDALISLPHPYAPLWKNIRYGQNRRGAVDRVLEEADCVEVMNGSLTGRANRRAAHLCWRLGKIPLGGSDGHRIEAVGSVLTVFDGPVESATLFDMVRSDRVQGFFSLYDHPRYMSDSWQVVKRHTRKMVSL